MLLEATWRNQLINKTEKAMLRQITADEMTVVPNDEHVEFCRWKSSHKSFHSLEKKKNFVLNPPNTLHLGLAISVKQDSKNSVVATGNTGELVRAESRDYDSADLSNSRQDSVLGCNKQYCNHTRSDKCGSFLLSTSKHLGTVISY